MTPRTYEARLRERVLPWQRRAVRLVVGKLADARAHAEAAVTAALRATPDGRASAARIRRSPSFSAALARLDELWAAIGGASVTSLDGLVQDATAACYLDAHAYWKGEVPAEFRAPGGEPSASAVRYARGLLWFGKPIRAAFDPPIARARGDLLAALGAAGSTRATSREGNAVLRAWETLHRGRLITHLGLAINDAGQRADLRAMRDVIDPRFLTDEAGRGQP